MVEVWFFELLKGVGKMFLNPMFYWAFIIVFIAGYTRIKRERRQFGTKVFDLFKEWKGTFKFSLIGFIILSILSIGLGLTFSYETILLLNIIVILLCITGRFTLLSTAYSIGFTYILLYFIPQVIDTKPYFQNVNYTGLAILLGILLIMEAILLLRMKFSETLPELVKTGRGKWVGQHHLKKLAILPLFVMVPTGGLVSFHASWPFIDTESATFGLLLLPILLGFDYKVKTKIPIVTKKRIGNRTLWIGILTLLIAIGSIWLGILSLVAVCFALFSRELLNYRFRMEERKDANYFNNDGGRLQVLAILPQSPAERLEILPGEIIEKVHGTLVHNEDELYEAVQASGSFCKIEVIDQNGEKRLLQSALYEGEHHRLGVILIQEPYKTDTQNELNNEGDSVAIE